MKRKIAGYTLVEMMMTVGIVGVVFAVGPPLLIGTSNFFQGTTARNDVQKDARQSLDIINRFLREAIDATIVIDTPPGGGPYSRISFTMLDGRTAKFWQRGNTLNMQVGSGVSVLSQNVAYVAFTFPTTNDPTLASVSVTMAKNIQLGQKQVLELSIQKVRVMN